METIKFIYYQENDMWVGWLEEYPDYKSQGKTLDELKENLKDIYEDLSAGKIPPLQKLKHPYYASPPKETFALASI
jgi:predicted RNase H-like HicB family nuclease